MAFYYHQYRWRCNLFGGSIDSGSGGGDGGAMAAAFREIVVCPGQVVMLRL